MIFYASSPESESLRSGPANLENDTEKKRAIKEKDSEDSKEFNTKVFKGLNGRV